MLKRRVLGFIIFCPDPVKQATEEEKTPVKTKKSGTF